MNDVNIKQTKDLPKNKTRKDRKGNLLKAKEERRRKTFFIWLVDVSQPINPNPTNIGNE